MITAAEREAEFRKDWEALLDKHEMIVDYDDGQLNLYGWTRYTEDGITTEKDFVNFNL